MLVFYLITGALALIGSIIGFARVARDKNFVEDRLIVGILWMYVIVSVALDFMEVLGKLVH